jgi:hypothetical protein
MVIDRVNIYISLMVDPELIEFKTRRHAMQVTSKLVKKLAE